MKMAARPRPAGELPLETLLALYGYTASDPERESCGSLPDVTLDKDEEESSADDLTASVTSHTSDMLRRLQGRDKDASVASPDSDASLPSNKEHKEIMVGSMYQAKIPPLSCSSPLERACGSEDQLLWKPDVLLEQEVEEFLLNAQRGHDHGGAAGDAVRDNQQALYELVKCNFRAEEALRRLDFNVKVFSEELCSWSDEECRSFERGYQVYGKNFHLIQANKVRTRSVGECVEYYYMWKKSERHKFFTQQATRLSRRKFSLQAGSMEDGEADVEAGELEGSNNSSGLLPHSTVGNGPLESPLPPQSSLDVDKRGGQLLVGLADLCPQQLFACPFSVSPVDALGDAGSCCPSPLAPAQLQSRPSPRSSQWANGSPPSCLHHHDDRLLPGSCFYQLHMCSGPFVSEAADCEAAGGSGSPHGLQVEFSLPSASPPCSSSSSSSSSSVLLGSLLLPSPVQQPRSLTQ